MSGTVGVAAFDYTVWAARFPKLALTVAEPLAASYWGEAGLFLANVVTSPIPDVAQRGVLLNLITGHLAILANRELVGRISSATEGSVSVTVDMLPMSLNGAWWMQTQPGGAFWMATAGLRTMRYIPGPLARSARYPGYPFRSGW